MALTDKQFARTRRRLRRFWGGPINVAKPAVNAAIQAAFDRISAAATRQAFADDIETAAPGVFNGMEKTAIAAVTIEEYVTREMEGIS